MIKIKTCKTHAVDYERRCPMCQKEQSAAYKLAHKAEIKARKSANYAKKTLEARLKRRQIALGMPGLDVNTPTQALLKTEPKESAVAVKVCITCKLPKPIKKFIVRHDTKDGHAGECSACRSKGNRNREAAKTQAAQPVWLTVHRLDDSQHSTINRKSLPARGMASSEYR